MTTKELIEVFDDMQILKHVMLKYSKGLQDGGAEARWALTACKPSFCFLGTLGIASERIERARVRYRNIMTEDLAYD